MIRLFFISICISLASISFAQDTVPQHWTIDGRIGVSTIVYNMHGIGGDSVMPHRDPLTIVLSTSGIARYKNLSIPFSVTLSDQDKQYQQAFNQFGLSPRWKWVTAHMGYRNINYSEFTLAGHTALGAGVDLNPGILRAGFFIGKFNRTAPGVNNYSIHTPACYDRSGYVARIGIGKVKNYFDLIFLNIKDDTTSLNYDPVGNAVSPAHNMVTGFNSKFTFTKKIWWESEGAVSVYTTNVKADSMNDVEDNQGLVLLNSIVPINFSSEYYYALRSALVYKEAKYRVKLQYKRIEPNYKSMGAYYFNSDIENITLEPMVRLMKNKLMMRGSIGYQHDNLMKNKRATSMRTIGMFAFSYFHNQKFSVDGNFSNYATNQEAGMMKINDTLVLRQNTTSYMLMPRYTIMNGDKVHIISLNYSNQFTSDKNTFTEDFTEVKMTNVFANYILSLIKIKTALSFGLNMTDLHLAAFNQNMVGATVGFNRYFLQNKLSAGAALSFNTGKYGDANGNIINLALNARYQMNQKHSFHFNTYFTSYMINSNTISSFNETKGEIGYVYSF